MFVIQKGIINAAKQKLLKLYMFAICKQKPTRIWTHLWTYLYDTYFKSNCGWTELNYTDMH